MADTKTSEVLSKEAGEQKDLGLYSQGKLKLNYDEEAGIWKQEYEAVKPSKMFIPPPPKEVKLPTDISMPTTPFEPSLPAQPAEPIVQPREKGESLIEKQQREKEERFGPGQDPMTFSKTMSNIFTPGTEQFKYYDTRNILKQEGNQLTVNFDQIDEAGGYGIPSLAGGLLKSAEKDIIQTTISNFQNAGIITEGPAIKDAKGMYTFTVDQDKMNKYTENVSSLANKITGGRGPNGEYIPPNEYLLDELGKLGKEEATKFISEMAIASDNDQLKTIIDRAVNFGDKGAAAALLTFQQGDEPLDLDAKGFLGFDKYNDAFKEAYTKTLKELQESSDTAPPSETKDRPTLEERRAETKRIDNLNREEKDKLLDELDTLLKQKEDERKSTTTTKSSQGLTSAQKEALAGSTSKSSGGGTLGTPPSGGTPKKGTGASGPPGNQSVAQKLSSAKKKYGSLATGGR